MLAVSPPTHLSREPEERGREGERERGREGEREGGNEGGREEVREGVMVGGRE